MLGGKGREKVKTSGTGREIFTITGSVRKPQARFLFSPVCLVPFSPSLPFPSSSPSPISHPFSFASSVPPGINLGPSTTPPPGSVCPMWWTLRSPTALSAWPSTPTACFWVRKPRGRKGERGRKEGERGVRPLIFSISAFFALRDRHKCRQGPHVGRKDTGEEKDGRKKG